MTRLMIFLAGMLVGGAVAYIPFFRPPPLGHWRYVFVADLPGSKYHPGTVIDCDFNCLPMLRQEYAKEQQ